VANFRNPGSFGAPDSAIPAITLRQGRIVSRVMVKTGLFSFGAMPGKALAGLLGDEAEFHGFLPFIGHRARTRFEISWNIMRHIF
jgi:hypothetical protein